MSVNPTLYCPIRGQLKIKAKTQDGLKFTEEKRRIDCINYLLQKNYPSTHFNIESTLVRFGHGGRNSFRTDIVVFKHSASELLKLPLEEQREEILLLSEIKRDHKEAEEAKKTQVKAAMGFLPDLTSLGVYWDDIEQSLFYKRIKGTKQGIVETSLSYLPNFGEPFDVTKLRYSDLKAPKSLVGLFKSLEDTIHPYVADISIRYKLLLQLLLVKIYDEGANKLKNSPMLIQDFSLFDLTDEQILEIFNKALDKSLNIYQRYLPQKVTETFNISGAALREISKHLASANLLASNPEVMQDFYMYFAKQLYKWDLAQYFTPYEVVDFIVRIINPQYGEIIKDPACGSADFLISAHRRGMAQDAKMGDKLFGADNSLNAVQISVLNMLLNGDGKSNIVQEDSLDNITRDENKFDTLLCNPPFGVKIQEKRPGVLAKFELGKETSAQQTGILFIELVVRQAKPGGRIAIIVPNGYLGNKGENYTKLRRWILCRARIAGIIGFPRFTFKKSGADVSASVLFLEKRKIPLEEPSKTEEYPVYVNLLESVGWEIGNKQAKKLYRHHAQSGAIVLNEQNEPVLDAGFEEVIQDLLSSSVPQAFPWMAQGVEYHGAIDGWSVPIQHILSHPAMILDPKRLCKKYMSLIEQIRELEHISLLDICEVLPEGWRKQNSDTYYYVELGNVNENSYQYQEMKGWQLPGRAKHQAKPGDIFIGSVWGSVGKWFMAGNEANQGNLIVTNGFYRLQIKPGKEQYLPDLIFTLSSEFYRVQMRALATGSDGLADIALEELGLVTIPIIKDEALKTEIAKYIQRLLDGTDFFRAILSRSVLSVFKDLNVTQRKTNFSQV